jgi:hypothetical protein
MITLTAALAADALGIKDRRHLVIGPTRSFRCGSRIAATGSVTTL